MCDRLGTHEEQRYSVTILALVILLGCGSVSSQQYENAGKRLKVDEEKLREAEKVLADHKDKLMEIPGVVGIGIGLTEKGDQPAIHLFVNVEVTGGAIPSAIPSEIGNVPVRIIKTDQIKAR